MTNWMRVDVNQPICKIEECEARPTKLLRGYCRPHYSAFMRTGDPRQKRAPRACLECDVQFVAESNGHRFCPLCRVGRESRIQAAYREAHREKNVAYNREWRKAHPDYHSQYNKKWREENPEAYLAYSRQYRIDNLELVRERFRAWEAANPDHGVKWLARNRERARQTTRRRRAARTKAAVYTITARDYARGLSRANHACTYCYVPFNSGVVIHWDHVVPLVAGGAHSIGNLVPSCATCNVSKGSNFLSEWRYRDLLSEPRSRRFYAASA